jgi:gliding motility-associated-like protein
MSPSLASRLRGAVHAVMSTAFGTALCLTALVPAVRAAAFQDSFSVTFSPRDVWPPSAVTDLAATPGAEGQMLLQWTAPDSNNYVFFPASSAAAGYQIRIATYSVSGAGGSTVAWWNSAADVRFLPAPAISATPPAPALAGTTQFLLLNNLWPGVTYYAMIVSSDAIGNVSDADVHSVPPGTQANALTFDAAPPAPLNTTVAQSGPASFLVTWNAVAAYDLDGYNVYFDSTPPYDFSHSSKTFVTSPATSLAIGGLSVGTYGFKVTALDRGAPRYPGVALESVAVGTTTAQLVRTNAVPQAPFGVALSSTAATVTLQWMPVTRFFDGTPFVVTTSPAANELSGYHVYRSTTPIQAAWSDVSLALSTATLTWTDLAGGPQYYYHVRAENGAGLSDRSVVRTGATKSAFVVAPDDVSYFEIKAPDVSPLEGVQANPNSAYLIQVSSHPQDLGGLNGRVMKSLEFDAYQGGQLLTPDFKIAEPGLLRMHYDVTASTLVSPSALFASAVTPSPENMSVYWFNGTAWVQLYGKLDPTSRTMTIATRFFGQYQLRVVERTGGFAFNQAGVSNRFITPNGDGKNDNVVFTYDNPRDSAVTGKIFDRQGRTVVSSLPPGPVSNSLMWDGTAGGRSVPGGVYIYQIQAEGQTFGGTVVIIK